MTQLFSNNANTLLDATITAGATSLAVSAGDGAEFQAPTDGDFELITLSDGTNIEVLKVTARSTDTFTVVRGQEGTTPFAFVAGAIVEGRVTADTLAGLRRANKNLVIGGDFHLNPWQRGVSFTSVAAATYTADRFEYDKVGAMVHDVSKAADAPLIAEAGVFTQNSLLVDCTTIDAAIAAGDFATIGTKLEGYDFTRIAQRKFTVSFWHKHTKTGVYCVAFRNSGADRSFAAEYTQAVSDTWERSTVTVDASPSAGTWDYVNGVGLEVTFALAAGTTFHTTADAWQTGNFLATVNQVNACDNVANNFKIALIQVEAGDTATDFEQRTFSEELELCQRYFQKSYDQGVAPGTSSVIPLQVSWKDTTTSAIGGTTVTFPVVMRAVPTSVVYDFVGNSGKFTTLDASANRTNNGTINQTTVSQSRLTVRTFATASVAGLEFQYTVDAEL